MLRRADETHPMNRSVAQLKQIRSGINQCLLRLAVCTMNYCARMHCDMGTWVVAENESDHVQKQVVVYILTAISTWKFACRIDLLIQLNKTRESAMYDDELKMCGILAIAFAHWDFVGKAFATSEIS
jgi:hypothetical protein